MALNKLLELIFGRVVLRQADPRGVLRVYPSTCKDTGFVTVTQPANPACFELDVVGDGEYEPVVAFLSRSLTKTKQKYSHTLQLISLVSWAMYKLRRYTTFAREVQAIVSSEEEVHMVQDS